MRRSVLSQRTQKLKLIYFDSASTMLSLEDEIAMMDSRYEEVKFKVLKTSDLE